MSLVGPLLYTLAGYTVTVWEHRMNTRITPVTREWTSE